MPNVSLIDGHIDEPKNTNYDRIKNMSVEELADFIYDAVDKICFENCTKDTGNKLQCRFGEDVTPERCVECMKHYLESEV